MKVISPEYCSGCSFYKAGTVGTCYYNGDCYRKENNMQINKAELRNIINATNNAMQKQSALERALMSTDDIQYRLKLIAQAYVCTRKLNWDLHHAFLDLLNNGQLVDTMTTAEHSEKCTFQEQLNTVESAIVDIPVKKEKGIRIRRKWAQQVCAEIARCIAADDSHLSEDAVCLLKEIYDVLRSKKGSMKSC